jgi:hypothetical protein
MKDVPRETFSGTLERKNASLKEAMKQLTVSKDKYTSPELEIQSKLGARSYYYDYFFQGATIVPRNLWFVKIQKLKKLGFDPKNPYVETDDTVEAKKPWDKVRISGKVESDFLYATMLSTDLLPFGYLRVRPVVLPVVVKAGKFRLLVGSEEAHQMGFRNVADYLSKAEEAWQKFATSKAKVFSVHEWVNYRNKVTNQDPTKAFKVLYTASATYLAACVIEQTGKFELQLDGSTIKLKAFVAESKTYWYETDSLDEANYLSAILNSTTVDQIIKPMQTRGLWGARDIHKRPLLLPIPKFKKTNSNHRRLAELGKIAQEKVRGEIPKLMKYKSIGRTRSEIRELLKDELIEIDNLGVKIMFEKGNPEGLEQFLKVEA